MNEVTYKEFVKKELERWVQLNSEGKDLPGIVNRVLETAYKNLTRIPEETPSLREGIMRERIKREIEMEKELKVTEEFKEKLNKL